MSPKLFFRAAPLLLSTVLLSSCAKSPAGGLPTPQALNRLTITLNTVRPINPAYRYAFAFDDDGNSVDGPVAITGRTDLTNRVVGGSFTVLVIYYGGQFIAYRRSSADNDGGDTGLETLDPAPSAFIADANGRLQYVSGSTLSFTLNLDATLPDNSRLFRGVNGVLPDRFDINFVTTNEARIDPNNNLPKTYDALGPNFASVYATLSINQTRTYTNIGANSAGVNEPVGDVFRGFDNNVTPEQLDRLDISDFQIDVLRRNQ